MSDVPSRGPSLRPALATGLCGALLVAGVALALTAGAPLYATDVPFWVLAAVLVPLYTATQHWTIDVELRGAAHGLSLVQLPLAGGVLFVAPGVHLVARLLGSCCMILLHRQRGTKALYNVASAAFEVGGAAFAVALVSPGAPVAVHWLALYAGLLAGDVVNGIVLSAVWRLVGIPVTLRQALRPLALGAPITLLFTCLAIITVTAARVEPLTGVVMLLLAGWLGVAYRTHRRVVGQQQATEDLYAFVKDLGPLTHDSAAAESTVERMRVLLHAERLQLALRRGETWCYLLAQEGRAVERHRTAGDPADPAAPSGSPPGTATLRSRGGSGGGDSMATPLDDGTDLIGLLTATSRLGNVRGFDMGDLRLLETVGAELSTALERGRLLADLERAATTDSLTGLPNLADTTCRLQELLDTRGGVVLAAVAVDSFREVNDTLGHEVGDELLLEVTRRLTLATSGAVLGRIGGGRFAVALPAEMAGGDAEMFGLGIRAQVEGTAQIGPVGTHVKLSVGVVSAPEHGSDAATLLRRAETAMYSARHAGGGPVMWEPAYEVQGTRRLAVVMALREALAGSAMGVAYQPKVDTVRQHVTGVEALARWTHPALGAVRPDEFIPLAEASGLMGPLTASVLRQSLTACRGWQRRAPGVGVSVNVSADTVLDPAFVTEVAALLTSVGCAPDLLTLELTESVLLTDPELAVARMSELRTLGVRLSVDDFGTGYSSLTYLKGLPVDEVKIDKGFIDALVHDPADRAVVRAVVDIAHTLGLKVVAEGVEQEDQQVVLRSLGVDEIQGYLHARPMAAHEFTGWLVRKETQVR